jgi:DNA-binding transcriptional LysR family regulator
VAPNHPILQNQDNPDDYPTIMLEDTANKLPRRNAKTSDHRNNLRVSTLDDKLQAQLAGLGHGWLPHWLAAPYLERGELVALGEPEPTSEQYLVWRKTDRGQALKWFVKALGEIRLH